MMIIMSIQSTRQDKNGKWIVNPGLQLRQYQHNDLLLLHERFNLSPYLYHIKGKGFPKYKELFHHRHIKLDIKDCYESISYSRIVGMFRSIIPNWSIDPPKIAKAHTFNGTLMRGSIASVKIMDCIMVAMDYRLHGLARKYGGYYARYMDDFLFYWTKNCPKFVAQECFRYIRQILTNEGFKLNDQKTSYENFNNTATKITR